MPVNKWLHLMVCFFLLLIYPAATAYGDVKVYPDTIRVGVLQDVPTIKFSVQGEHRLLDEASNRIITEDIGGSDWTAVIGREGIALQRNGIFFGEYIGPIKVEDKKSRFGVESGEGTLIQQDNLLGFAVATGQGDNINFLGENPGGIYYIDSTDDAKRLAASDSLGLFNLEKNGQQKSYRGALEIRRNGNQLTGINELLIEEYLYGVVPAEMPIMFPLEALKAQAVTARSYVISQLGSYAKYGFDVLDNQNSSVYGGYSRENPLSSKAVDETRGLVLVYRDQPIAAFYHSSSGGYTDNSEEVWTNPLGYIRAKPDPADFNNKYYNWTVTYSNSQLIQIINSQLKKYWPNNNYQNYSVITDLQELELTGGGRVKKLLIMGIDINGKTQQAVVFNAERVRALLGLKSALFSINKTSGQDGTLELVTITGSGWGHGLGMSQWGAAGLAGQGYSFQDILQYYYTGVDLVTYYGK